MAVEVLCIGHAAFDQILFLNGFPQENVKYEVHEMLAGAGGPAANAAMLLGRWGVSCAFAGVIGDDLYGREVLAELSKCGVETSLMESRKGHATPASTILVNTRSGSRTIINCKAKVAPLVLAGDPVAELSPAVILADGHELQAAQTALAAYPRAYSILDAGAAREGTLTLAGQVNALIASERFAMQATDLATVENEEQLRVCLGRLQTRFEPEVTAITLGERGVVADWGEGLRRIPAPRVQAIDTTGAGDIFHGAAAYGVLKGLPWERILRLANAAAAISVARRGGSHAIPSLAEVQGSREQHHV